MRIRYENGENENGPIIQRNPSELTPSDAASTFGTAATVPSPLSVNLSHR